MLPTARPTPKRGEIYLINFDPTVGSEIKKTRPAVIIQNDIANRWSPITIVAAITSQVTPPIYPTEVLVTAGEGGLDTDSTILLNQIRSVDRERLIQRLGRVTPATLAAIDQALAASLGLAA